MNLRRPLPKFWQTIKPLPGPEDAWEPPEPIDTVKGLLPDGRFVTLLGPVFRAMEERVDYFDPDRPELTLTRLDTDLIIRPQRLPRSFVHLRGDHARAR